MVAVIPDAIVVPSGPRMPSVPGPHRALPVSVAETYSPATPWNATEAAWPICVSVRFAGVPMVADPTAGVDRVSAKVFVAVLLCDATSE